jgi:hypothetical protein
MSLYHTMRATAATLLAAATVCLAQEDYPVAQPTPQEAQQAAIGMLLMMVGGLVAVVLLLRWIGRKQPPPPRPTDGSPFTKAEEFFSKQGK